MTLRRSIAVIGMLLMSTVMGTQAATAQTKVRFTLDWIPGQRMAPF